MRIRQDKSAAHSAQSAREFGKVAVVFGGTSTEREVSLKTGAAVLAALRRRGVDAFGFDPRDQLLPELLSAGTDRVWIALHGPGGEDGTLQGALECLGIAYTGSGVMGSAIGMDKLRTKRLAQAAGIPTGDYVELTGEQDLDAALARLALPLIVKPATQGSSVGMTKVERPGELLPAYRVAAAVDHSVLAEAWISGAEYTVSILNDRALPSIRIQPATTFYDYEAKYLRDDTQYFCPSGLSKPAEEHLAALGLAAFAVVGADGWGRADFMMDSAGRPQLLEVNTVPGMTDHSLVPMAAKAAGINFDELVWRILESSFTRVPVQQGGA
jgi:D-alanine-D-alanine ligase